MADSLKNLVRRIRTYHARKHDEVQPATALQCIDGQYLFNEQPVQATATAERQLCSLVRFPYDFYRRLNMEERSPIFTRLFRELDDNDKPKEFMFRFSNDTLYGIVSTRYAALDNDRIIDVLNKAKTMDMNLVPIDSLLDFDHTRIRLVPEHSNGSELIPLINITNSENGLGSLQVWAGVYRQVCSNGLMVPVGDVARTRWVHIGVDPDFNLNLDVVLNVSRQYMKALDAARTRYLTCEEKSGILVSISQALGHKIAGRVCDVANRHYEGAPTLFHAINAITQAAQLLSPAEQSQAEAYASTLLAA